MPLSRSAHVDTFTRDRLPPDAQWPELSFDLPELAYPDRLNCAQRLIDDAIGRYGADRRAVLTATTEWSYGVLRDNAHRVAALLAGQFGLQPGNRVLVRAPNNPWLVAIWLGILEAGGVVVLTMPLLRP
ncbi:MAG TPA: AMP-binding protein, partial [Jiangellaceae bacterium]